MSLKKFETLIKIEDTHIKALQKEMSNLSTQIETLNLAILKIEKAIFKEQEFTNNHPEVSYIIFVNHMKTQKNEHKNTCTFLEEKLENLRKDLIRHFEKQKSFEKIIDTKNREIEHAIHKKTQTQLDEFAKIAHITKHK